MDIRYDARINFAIFLLESDGMKVEPFTAHPDGNGQFRQLGLNPQMWFDWLNRLCDLSVPAAIVGELAEIAEIESIQFDWGASADRHPDDLEERERRMRDGLLSLSPPKDELLTPVNVTEIHRVVEKTGVPVEEFNSKAEFFLNGGDELKSAVASFYKSEAHLDHHQLYKPRQWNPSEPISANFIASSPQDWGITYQSAAWLLSRDGEAFCIKELASHGVES